MKNHEKLFDKETNAIVGKYLTQNPKEQKVKNKENAKKLFRT